MLNKMFRIPVYLVMILVAFDVFAPVCAPDPQTEGLDKLESFCEALNNLTKSMEQDGVEKLADQFILNTTSTSPESADSARFLSDVYTFHSTPAKPAANHGKACNVVVPRPPAFEDNEEWNSESDYSDVDMHDDNLERSQHFECSGQSSVQHNEKPGTI